MELKYNMWEKAFVNPNGSNRTFMELKFLQRFALSFPGGVLIAPLWN